MDIDITIKYQDRRMKYQVLDMENILSEGSSIGEILTWIRSNQPTISQISLIGRSNSYTFSRQVYLFCNILRELSGAKLIINGEEKLSRELALPSYNLVK